MNHYQKLLKQHNLPKKTEPDDFFMNNSVNLDEELASNRTLLQNAIMSQDEDLFDSIIKIKKEYATKPHDVNIIDRTAKKWTALHYAVFNGSVDGEHMVKELLDLGANPNIKDSEGKIPLFTAVEMGSCNLIEMLLNHGSKADTGLLLHTALLSDRPEAFNLLLDKDVVDIETVDEDGNTALHIAAKLGYANEADALVEKARSKGILRKYINLQNKGGNTALHEAAEQGNYQKFGNMRHLEERDSTIKNNDGKTAHKIDEKIREDNNKKIIKEEEKQIRKRNRKEKNFEEKVVLGRKAKKQKKEKEIEEDEYPSVPFYLTSWFKSLVAFVVLLAVFYLFFAVYIRSRPYYYTGGK